MATRKSSMRFPAVFESSGSGSLISKFLGGLLMLSANPSAATGDKEPAILTDRSSIAENPLPDFSYAGFGFGVKPIPDDPGTIVRVTDHGAVADDGKDDSQAVLRALQAAAAVRGKVTVRFPAGRIQISEILPIDRSDIVLEGVWTGGGGTELYFPRPLTITDKSDRQKELREYFTRENKFQREPDQNIDNLFSPYSWSGGYVFVGPRGTRPVSYDGSKDKRDRVLTAALSGKQFTRGLKVVDVKALKIGQVVQLQWFAESGPRSAILRSIYGDAALLPEPIGSHHWTFPNRPVVTQATRIVAIKGNGVTLGDPLLHDVSADQPAVVADWQHLTNVGIQNMRLTFPDAPWFGHHLEQGYNGVYMTGVFDGWIRNLVVHNSDSAILTDNAASLTIDHITTTGERKAHYSVHVGAVHNVLVSDILVQNPVVHPLSVNTRSTRSVYRRATVTREAVLDQHSGSNHQNLFDQLTLSIAPTRNGAGEWTYRLWDGGGAPYWKPGHGRYNTFWNVSLVIADDRVARSERVNLLSGLEGPGARIVGLHGDRPVAVSYTPTAYLESVDQAISMVPSLYDYQLAKRRPNNHGKPVLP